MSAMKAVPWTKVGEPTVLAGMFGKKLIKQQFENPHLPENHPDKIQDFALIEQKPWSVVFALSDDGNVLVVREYKQGRDAIGDELPAGTAGTTSEDPEVVARRELREETGHEADEIISLGHMYMATRNSSTKAHCYLALGCRKVGDGKLDHSEVIEAREVPLGEWLKLVVSGAITEPSAITATVRALPYLRRRGLIGGDQFNSAILDVHIGD